MGGVAYFAWTGRVYGGYCKVLKSSVTSPNLNTNQGYGYKLWEKCPDPSEDCLSARPEPKCEGATLVTFVEPGTADSRGCMVYGREENVCAMGHCNAEAGKCDEINHEAPIPCSSNIDVDWACMECGGKQGKACTAKAGFGSSDLVEGKCNANYGCAKASDEVSLAAKQKRNKRKRKGKKKRKNKNKGEESEDSEEEPSVEDCLSARPEPKCEGDTLITFVELGTADSRGCMVYGREEHVCAMGHCNAEAGKCDEIDGDAPIPCSSNIDVDWACMECGGKQGKACTAKAGFGSSDLVEGKCNANYGCAKAEIS